MSQNKFQLTQNGQELQENDVNFVAAEAAEADDLAISSLMRLAPFTSSATKLILPFGHTSDTTTPTVLPSTGSVDVFPFKAIVGSRDTYGNIGAANWNDSRCVAFVGNSGLSKTVLLNSLTGSPGFGRWDLIYASVTVDANAASVTRYVKDPTTKLITAQSLVTQLSTTVAVNYLPGTPLLIGSHPVLPTLPADSAGTYNIPLAYVMVRNPFTSGVSSVVSANIVDVAPTPTFYRHLGVAAAKPANALFTNGGATMSSSPPFGDWMTNLRPKQFMPPSMIGMEHLWFWIDTSGPSQATHTVVDDSRSWRDRIFMINANYSNQGVTNATTPWQYGSLSGPYWPINGNPGPGNFTTQMGQSFQDDGSGVGTIGVTSGIVASITQDSSHFVFLYVDYADSKLKVAYSAGTTMGVFVWLMASPFFPNF